MHIARRHFLLFNQTSAITACKGGERGAKRGIGRYYEEIEAHLLKYHRTAMERCLHCTRREI